MAKHFTTRVKPMSRRNFLRSAGAVGTSLGLTGSPLISNAPQPGAVPASFKNSDLLESHSMIDFPRRFTGAKLSRISFPLGGIGTGCIGLGGRGNLQDWEIFNRPNVGFVPNYCFPVIWAKRGDSAPVARVLERRFLPPYDVGPENLGRSCGPGLPRLHEAVFAGSFPLASVDFFDDVLPVKVRLEGFSCMQPVDAELSGLPMALLQYEVTNLSSEPAEVVIAWSCDNMLGKKGRQNERRSAGPVQGILMTNPTLAPDDPMHGTVALSVFPEERAVLKLREYWETAQWNLGESHFWYDTFAPSGDIGETQATQSMVCSVSCRQTIAPGTSSNFRFMFNWHFPNRTPSWCGWYSPKGEEKTNIGNYYCNRFDDAWAIAAYVEQHLSSIEHGTREFTRAMIESTLPPSVLEAASANLSTLVSPTVFRTSDGAFQGFEGCGESAGLGPGTCTHVWNYEAATAFLYPSLSRSMRTTSFIDATDEEGYMNFRHYLPTSSAHWGAAAADGQMGQIAKLYMDWKMSGDTKWLQRLWPACQRALAYAWREGGWDHGATGVMNGVQHNTYDIELYGPNPLCELWYLAALRASAEMATALGDQSFADKCRAAFEGGSKWTEANLFNGQFFFQQVRGIPLNAIAPGLRQGDGALDPLHPDFQVGSGCLIDQLMGQYLCELAGMGALLPPDKIRTTLASIQRYNYRPSMQEAPSTMRAFTIGDQAALIMCDYSHGGRPLNPFPYFAENFTGSEYAVASLMMQYAMVDEGVQAFTNVRRRYDGEFMNPYSEAEYGRHYARAMASWAAIPVLSGFRYDGVRQELTITPVLKQERLCCVWSAPDGWGRFVLEKQGETASLHIEVVRGTLTIGTLRVDSALFSNADVEVLLDGRAVPAALARGAMTMDLELKQLCSLHPDGALLVRTRQTT